MVIDPNAGCHAPEARRRDGGFALPAVVLVLLVGSILAVFSLRTGRDELHAAAATLGSARAFYAAEAGLGEVIAEFDSLMYDTLMPVPGDSIRLPWTTIENGAKYQAWVRRIDGGFPTRYFTLGVTALGRPGLGGRRTVFADLRTDNADICCRAAVTGGLGGRDARFDEEGLGGVTVTGLDEHPAGWDHVCPDPLDHKPGVLWKDTGLVEVRDGAVATGNPGVAEDPAINHSELFDWGWLDYDDLVAMADQTWADGSDISGGIYPRESGVTCDKSFKKNWGAPESPGHPCFDYFPIIHAKGDLRIRDGVGIGQGILLVDGELRIEDSFTFYGIIITASVDPRRTRFEDHVTIYGGLIAGEEVRVEDGAEVRLSQCAADRALAGNRLFKIQPLSRRAWRQGWR